MYGVRIIKSREELEEFGRLYGRTEEIGDWGDSVDFEKSAVAVKVLCLSSGEYKYSFYGVNVNNEYIGFDYSLISRRDCMTDDEAALYMFAEIPSELAE